MAKSKSILFSLVKLSGVVPISELPKITVAAVAVMNKIYCQKSLGNGVRLSVILAKAKKSSCRAAHRRWQLQLQELRVADDKPSKYLLGQ